MAAQPRRKVPAPPPPLPGPGPAPRPGPARAPAAGQPGEQVGGRHPPVSAPGRCSICLATVAGCCTRKAVGYATGATARGTGPWCARRSIWRPAGARTRQGETILPPRTGGASTPPPSSATTWRATALALRAGRTGVCWAGAWAEAGGRDPEGTRGSTRWSTTARSKTTRDTAPLRPSPEQARNTRTETAPPRPEGTGHPAKPTRSTEQQDKQLETQPSRPSKTRPAAQAPPATLPTPAESKDISANRINLFMIQEKLIMFTLWECSDIPLKISTAG